MVIFILEVYQFYFLFREDHENFRGQEKFEGYAVDLIGKLSEIMEFDYEFMIVNGNGKYNPETKQWDGIIRKLIDHVSASIRWSLQMNNFFFSMPKSVSVI